VNEKQKLIVIVGPTAVGKTEASLAIARHFNGEIISGDSMQVYKGMDIGTAKIRPDDMQGIPHHLIDIKEPDESFSVAEFQSAVRNKIVDIAKRGAMPVIAGGTGLYIASVLYDYQFSEEPPDNEYRRALEKKAREGKAHELHEELARVDPGAARNIHPHNVKRIIRALEMVRISGIKKSEKPVAKRSEPLYDAVLVGLTMDREKLYRRINRRVDTMMEQGLLKEAKYFYDKGIRNAQSVQAIGYKELYAYFDGRLSLEEAVSLLKKNTRRYAKRQLTWFRNKMDVTWFDMTNEREHLYKIREIIQFIAGKLQ
jgi:tRNA dimethylallyltransferase